MYSAQPLPHPLAPSIPSLLPLPPNPTWGGKPWNSPAFTFKWETRFLLGKQRVKAIRAPSSGEPGPPRRRVLCHLLAATGLARPLPLSRASPPLHSPDPRKVSGWVGPGSARLRKPYSGQGSLTQAVALGDPRGRRARVPLLAAARGQGVRGDRALQRRQLQRPGSQLRRGTEHAGAPFRSCSAGPGGWGAWGCRPQRPARRWEPGALGSRGEVGGEPEAGLGWIINTLGGIRHAGSRPATARAPKWVPGNGRAGLKGGSVCGRDGMAREPFPSGRSDSAEGKRR